MADGDYPTAGQQDPALRRSNAHVLCLPAMWLLLTFAAQF
jgi:hypothetical protein